MHYVCEPTHSINGKVTLHSLTTQICHSSIWEAAGLNLYLDTAYLEALGISSLLAGILQDSRPTFISTSFHIHYS